MNLPMLRLPMLDLARGVPGGGASTLALSLDFATLDAAGLAAAGVTFARASSATRVNGSGLIESVSTDAPRFDHDYQGNALGLMIETQRTNLVVQSAAIVHGSGWTNGGMVLTDNALAAPNGAITAEKIAAGVPTANKQIYTTASISGTTAAAMSAFFKPAGDDIVQVTYGGATNQPYANTNVATGIVTAVGNSGSARVDRYVDSWYRASLFGSPTTNGQWMVFLVDDNPASARGPTYAGDGTSGAYIWGAQMEAGAIFSTSYIPTSGSSATRAAETAIMSDISAWWDAAENTVVIEGVDSPGSGTRIIWQADDNTANNRITVWTDGTTCKVDIVTGGVSQATLSLGTITPRTPFKVALAIAANDVAASLNGATEATDVSVTLPTVDRCRFGHNTSGNQLCGHLKSFTAYAERKADVEALAA